MTSTFEKLHLPLFDGLTDEEKASLFGISEERSFSDGNVIIVEGEEGDNLFIVASGSVMVEKVTLDQQQEALISLGPGECFGELSLVDSHPRSATVRSIGDTKVRVFKRVYIDEIFAKSPSVHHIILENLVRIMSGRLRRVDENLIQSIYDSVIVVDRDLRILEWNRAPNRWRLIAHDVSPEHFIGGDVFVLLPHLQEGFRERIEGVIENGKDVRFQVEYEDEEAGMVYIDTVVVPYQPGGQVLGAVIANRDITGIKSLENQLIQSEKLAMSGQMAADIGHELNNYIFIISGHAQLLSARPEFQASPQAVKTLGIINDQVQKISRFTSSLMDFSAQNAKKQATDLNDLIVKLIEFIQPQHRFRSVTFDLGLEEKLPKLNVDPGQIQQVFLNLFSNAADAMGKGKVVARSEYLRDVEKVVIEVNDNGPGMSDEVLAKIFETGFTTKRTGHGFGLSICNRIVENHGGDLQVVSEVGKGTAFKLTLPSKS